ncbi:hypothetical protein I7I53_03471 [Histoplasma capsulatum var. duboisii H88]|uniref:Uncharacterized protein n=1 Tax=Ajellomyces capsulatus (strain H88) TaxID=544711 RepID=A0A8A1LMM4_AJEC8|nr:hypothetical protein I7I53_03471 [Histoplasma capsulatum var. duboisii H88]
MRKALQNSKKYILGSLVLEGDERPLVSYSSCLEVSKPVLETLLSLFIYVRCATALSKMGHLST